MRNKSEAGPINNSIPHTPDSNRSEEVHQVKLPENTDRTKFFATEFGQVAGQESMDRIKTEVGGMLAHGEQTIATMKADLRKGAYENLLLKKKALEDTIQFETENPHPQYPEFLIKEKEDLGDVMKSIQKLTALEQKLESGSFSIDEAESMSTYLYPQPGRERMTAAMFLRDLSAARDKQREEADKKKLENLRAEIQDKPNPGFQGMTEEKIIAARANMSKMTINGKKSNSVEAVAGVPEKKEKREGASLFEYQIENNAHVSAGEIKRSLPLFMKSLDAVLMGDNFQSVKAELSDILSRQGVEYEKGKETVIAGENKEILQPLLDFRRELDEWNSITGPRVDDFKTRLFAYMQDTFGIEVQEPKEGEKYDAKERAVAVVETNDKSLDRTVKKVISPSFRINEKLYDYYQKWYAEKKREMDKQYGSLQNTLSKEEFHKIVDENQEWLKRHGLPKTIQPAWVEVYRYRT